MLFNRAGKKKRWLERWRLCGRSAQESSGGGEKVGWESWESWESEQVGLTTLVQSPDVITLTSWS